MNQQTAKNPFQLTNKQLGILQSVILHQLVTREDIADHFGMQPGTVRSHVYEITKKMGAKNLLHAVLMFLQTKGAAP